jgi:hypothetical protein
MDNSTDRLGGSGERNGSTGIILAHDTLTVNGVTELRLSVPEAGKRLLPLPIAAWHATVGPYALNRIAMSPSARSANRRDGRAIGGACRRPGGNRERSLPALFFSPARDRQRPSPAVCVSPGSAL